MILFTVASLLLKIYLFCFRSSQKGRILLMTSPLSARCLCCPFVSRSRLDFFSDSLYARSAAKAILMTLTRSLTESLFNKRPSTSEAMKTFFCRIDLMICWVTSIPLRLNRSSDSVMLPTY